VSIAELEGGAANLRFHGVLLAHEAARVDESLGGQGVVATDQHPLRGEEPPSSVAVGRGRSVIVSSGLKYSAR
jgi:hypothetical protein